MIIMAYYFVFFKYEIHVLLHQNIEGLNAFWNQK